VRYKLAILKVLAKQPGGRATLDEVRREAGRIVSSLDQVELKRFNAIGDVDICHSGLVLRDDDGWQITRAGLALLDRLEDVTGCLLETFSSPTTAAVEPTNKLVRSEEPLRPFAPETGMPLALDPPSSENRQTLAAAEIQFAKPQIRSFDRHRIEKFSIIAGGRKLFRSLGAFITTNIDTTRRQSAPRNPAGFQRKSERSIQTAANAAFALLALLSVIACVLAAIAFGQLQSLKVDIAGLRRELLPVKERFAKFEEAENQRRDQDKQQEAQKRSETGKDQSAEVRSDPTPLNLTREEIQLVREYIKPAPSPASAGPEINVGDAVGGAMIPLPSALTDKVPKLVGARFTTRNGTIVLVKKDSRHADAVLGPN
jgi:hypothetical protein